MDHWIKEQKHTKHYFRYCDDIVIFGKNKRDLHSLLDDVIVYTENLNVHLKSNYRIFPKTIGVNFLGYISRKPHIRIRKNTKKNFIDKILRMNLDALTEHDINVLGSYWGILKHADCRNLWYVYTKQKNFN